MIYLMNTNNMLIGSFNNIFSAEEYIAKNNLKGIKILKDYNDMKKYISRIVFMKQDDGTLKCIYNNKDFWTSDLSDIIKNFDNYEFYDFLGKKVDYQYRFELEANTNKERILAIDGVAGEVDYNITIGNEFISLFREECIFTDFQTVTPLEIAQKLMAVISLVQTGSFREAKLVLKTIENDAFLTPERIQKYEDMLDSADAITYATPEEFFYTAQENT